MENVKQKSGILFEDCFKVLIFDEIKTHKMTEMKRLILLTAAIALFFGSVNAQTAGDAPLLLNHNTLVEKAEKSDEAIAHDKKKLSSKTWVSRGSLFQDIDNEGLEQAEIGFDKKTLKLVYQDPISTEKTDDGVEILTYEHIKYLFENNQLRGWIRIDPIAETPLDEAFRSYLKAIELTEEVKREKLEEKMKEDLDELKVQYRREGQNLYYQEDFQGSLHCFEQFLEVNKIGVYDGVVDTLMINYCGIVSREIGRRAKEKGDKELAEKMYNKTINYYQELAQYGYGGSSAYVQMTRDFYAIEDTLGAIENLKKGIEQYPDSSILVTLVAQAYYLMDENEEGLNFLAKRLEQEPQCPAAYYWKGLFITNKDNVSEDTIKMALALYDTSLMYDPSNASVWYQSGYVNYAIGANYFEQESYEEDDDVRAELIKKGTDYYEEAVNKLEKTYEKADNDPTLKRESLELLKRIYYKLYGADDDRYKSINERLNKL